MTKPMRVIGLTGGIGMGKSTAARILRSLGLPVYVADKAVHALLRKNGRAAKEVARLFPAACKNGAIDRKQLGKIVFANAAKLKRLEKILHPLVREMEAEFLGKMRKRKKPAAILEIPLLFETGADKRCDYVFCVTAPLAVQRNRVLHRREMTVQKLKAILKRQMPDREKRRLADYVIDTGGSYAATKKQLRSALYRMGIPLPLAALLRQGFGGSGSTCPPKLFERRRRGVRGGRKYSPSKPVDSF
jgi:dephospho-CoA kinase